MPEQRLVPANPRAAFDALRALEDAVLAPRPDPAAALETVKRLQDALLGDQQGESADA